MKYYYTMKNAVEGHIICSNVPKSRWNKNTMITWQTPTFKHTSILSAYHLVLPKSIIRELKRITEKEAFMKVI